MALRFHRPTMPIPWLIPLLVVNLFIINLGLSIASYPSTKLMQDIICKHHLGLTFDDLLPEPQCHDRAVQRELNIVEIGAAISSTIAGALVSLPLGMLADRIGRVPILGLSILSLFLSESYFLFICWRWRRIPLRAIWGSGAIILLGGGRGVAEAMVFTSISDVIPESKRNLLPMGRCRCSLCISLGLVAIGGIILVALMPETLPSRDSPAQIGEDTPIIHNNQHHRYDVDEETVLETPMASTKSTFKALFRRPAVYLLPGAVLTMPAVSTQYGIIMRLMPIQFDWPLSRAALLLSLNAAVTLITLLLILPLASYALYKKTSASALQRDRILARASVILFVLGSFFLMMVNKASLIIIGVVLSGLGSGVPTLCRTLLVALIGKHKIGSVFGIIAAGEVLGILACELVIGPLFDIGLGTWLGLPFCLGLVVSILTCSLTWLVRKAD